jgi:glutamyl-tRNA reductase
VEPTLMVVGLNYRTAPMAVRERFWIDEHGRYETLSQLSRAEGIDEVIVLSTCNRTEFYLWANDVTLAANSVMRLLGADYGLRLQEWKHFYRLLDEPALLHIFRVVSCLDSMVLGAPEIVIQVKDAWQQAQKAGASGRFLDAVLQKALTVSRRVRSETAIGKAEASIPYAAVELARQIFGTLDNKKILLIGAGEMSELAARGLLNQGGTSVSVGVVNRTFENAAELAAKLGGTAIPFEERWQHMADADIIISSTSCPHTIISRKEVEAIVYGRRSQSPAGQSPTEQSKTSQSVKGRTLVIVDLAMPRDVDPSVRNVKGVFLCDLDDLENVSDHKADEREAAAADAHKILQAETQGFRLKLMAERVVPTVVALRQRLDEFCRQELDAFRDENGPFSKDQDEMLNAVMLRMTQRIAGSLARELRELPEKVEQEQLTTALHRLFHLPASQMTIAHSAISGPKQA